MAGREEFYLIRLGGCNSLHKITSGELTIGRDVHAFITCTSPFVSRRHLLLSRKLRSSQIFIKDLKTANGSFINNQKMVPDIYYPIEDNDIISLGTQENIPPEERYIFKLTKKITNPDECNNDINSIIIIDDSDEEIESNNIVSNSRVGDPSQNVNKNLGNHSNVTIQAVSNISDHHKINTNSGVTNCVSNSRVSDTSHDVNKTLENHGNITIPIVSTLDQHKISTDSGTTNYDNSTNSRIVIVKDNSSLATCNSSKQEESLDHHNNNNITTNTGISNLLHSAVDEVLDNCNSSNPNTNFGIRNLSPQPVVNNLNNQKEDEMNLRICDSSLQPVINDFDNNIKNTNSRVGDLSPKPNVHNKMNNTNDGIGSSSAQPILNNLTNQKNNAYSGSSDNKDSNKTNSVVGNTILSAVDKDLDNFKKKSNSDDTNLKSNDISNSGFGNTSRLKVITNHEDNNSNSGIAINISQSIIIKTVDKINNCSNNQHVVYNSTENLKGLNPTTCGLPDGIPDADITDDVDNVFDEMEQMFLSQPDVEEHMERQQARKRTFSKTSIGSVGMAKSKTLRLEASVVSEVRHCSSSSKENDVKNNVDKQQSGTKTPSIVSKVRHCSSSSKENNVKTDIDKQQSDTKTPLTAGEISSSINSAPKPPDEVNKNKENVTKPKENVIKSKENISKPKENITKPKENVTKSKDNVTKPKEKTKSASSKNGIVKNKKDSFLSKVISKITSKAKEPVKLKMVLPTPTNAVSSTSKSTHKDGNTAAKKSEKKPVSSRTKSPKQKDEQQFTPTSLTSNDKLPKDVSKPVRRKSSAAKETSDLPAKSASENKAEKTEQKLSKNKSPRNSESDCVSSSSKCSSSKKTSVPVISDLKHQSSCVENPSTSQLSNQRRSSVRSTKHASPTPMSELVSSSAGQNKKSNQACSSKSVIETSCAVSTTTDKIKLNRIPRKDAISRKCSHDEIQVRRQSIMKDLYDTPPTKPIVARRKSVSFILDNSTDEKKPDRRNSCGVRSILKRSKSIETVDVPDWLKLFLKIVIRWNPSWIEERKRMKTEKNDLSLPPIFYEDKTTAPIMTYVFKDFEQYMITLTNLVVLEVWELLYTTCISNKSTINRHKLNMQVVGEPMLPCDGTKITKILCKCTTTPEISDLVSKKSLNSGTMLIVNFPGASKREFFGLVTEHNSKSPRYSNKETLVSFYIKFEPEMHNRIVIDMDVTIKIVSSVRNEMMLAKAIHSAKTSSLSKIIISPKETQFTNFHSTTPLQWCHELNPSQKKAVQQCISAISSQIPSIQLIHGPPGTGKSRVIASLILEYYQRNIKNKSNRGKVLICSQTNIAVDEIIKRLLDAKREHKAPTFFEMVRVGRFDNMQPWAQEISTTTLAQKFRHTPEMQNQVKVLKEQIEKYRSKMNVDGPQGAYCTLQFKTYKKKLDDLISTAGESSSSLHKEETEIIRRADVICTTLQGCSISRMQMLNNKIAFCIIDEAAKAVEPEVLIPLSLGVECLIMVGDNQQLTGFTHSLYAKQKGFNESMFSRLLHSMDSWKDSSLQNLDVQYRMAPSIAYFPNQAFYEGRLQNGKKYPPLPKLIPEYRVVHIPGSDSNQGETGANFNEAKVVSKLTVAIRHVCVSEKINNMTMCVLTPYSAHRDTLQEQLRRLSCTDIEVHTVDSFQGQERDIVIISLARSAGTGFLVDPGRMSVLLTRAKRSCIVCCNPDFVKGQPLWESFLEDAEKRKMARKLPRNICKGQFRNTPKEMEVLLQYIA